MDTPVGTGKLPYKGTGSGTPPQPALSRLARSAFWACLATLRSSEQSRRRPFWGYRPAIPSTTIAATGTGTCPSTTQVSSNDPPPFGSHSSPSKVQVF